MTNVYHWLVNYKMRTPAKKMDEYSTVYENQHVIMCKT